MKALLIFLCAVCFIWFGLIDAEQTSISQDTERVKEAIQKASLTCYSMEGRYAKDLAYLQKYYGLYLEQDAYHIQYRYQGQNLMPEISVYHKGGKDV